MHPVLLLLGSASPLAWAGPLSDAETFITTYAAEPPNVIFVLDLSGGLEDDCGDGESCLSVVQRALSAVVSQTDWAYFGVVGTTPDADESWYTAVTPVGNTHDGVIAAIQAVSSNYTGARNLAEVLADVGRNYLAVFPSSSAMPRYAEATFDESPICTDCQETHLVVLTSGRPLLDRYPIAPIPSSAALGWDVMCTTSGDASTVYDTGCLYDNIVHLLYTRDHRLDLGGKQSVVTHTIAINREAGADDIAEPLFWSAAHKTAYKGWFWDVTDADGVHRSLSAVMEDVHRSLAGTSSPTLQASGELALYAYAETVPYEPLSRGHLRAFSLGIDATDPGTFGQVVYDSASPVGGARWDAGELLAARPVSFLEENEDDRDGEGRRDIYTFLPELAALSSGDASALAAREAGRFAFDRSLVTLVASAPSVLSLLLPAGESGATHPWDLDGDTAVDQQDLQRLVDFVRGVPSAPFRYLDQGRGSWRLGDAPRAVPALVWSGQRGGYGADAAYRRFLSALEWSDFPDIALLAANDGMLHAFDLETGAELWAWVPARLLYLARDHAREGRLVDLLWSGRPRLLEGSPTVEDVWIDTNGDGVKQCVSVPDDCEWRRVAVVSQGHGGGAVLALDVTDPTAPRFLWEQVDPDHSDGTGHGPRQPVVVNLRDGDTERWTALWGTGRGRVRQESPTQAALAEPTLYLRALEDSYEALPQATYAAQATTGRFSSSGMVHHPDASAADIDGDGRPEGGWLAGTPAAVDTNDDGSVDIIYVHLTDDSGASPKTHLYKLLLNGDDPEASTWCHLYDASAVVGAPLETFYAPTTSWMADGSLGIYWGSGSPYDGNTATQGRFFGLQDRDPAGCLPPEPLCGTDGSLALGAGTRLTDDPIVYDGAVYFATWRTDPDGCGEGEGHIYGLRFDTCQPAMPDPSDPDTMVTAVSVSAYPSTIALSDQGTLLYPASPFSAAPILAVDTRDPLQGTDLLSYALLQH